MSEEEVNITIKIGAPMWVVTFGDLMSLLLCFFVLLLSFSEMDKAKYKEVAGSLEKAFGVSYETKAMGIPQGITFVAKDFDQPLVPTFAKDQYIKMGQEESEGEKGKDSGKDLTQALFQKDDKFSINQMKEYSKAVGQQLKEKIEEGLEEMEEEMRAKGGLTQEMEDEMGEKGGLTQEMEDMKDLIGVEVGENEVTIRMMGETAFDSGKAEIRDEMRPLLKKIAVVLNEQKGEITVVGHTDNVPIVGGIHKTNLGLSMARAASVADYLLNKCKMSPERISTMGFGEYRPIETNASSKGRQRNRRVEIKLKSTPEDIEDVEDYIKKPKIFPNAQ